MFYTQIPLNSEKMSCATDSGHQTAPFNYPSALSADQAIIISNLSDLVMLLLTFVETVSLFSRASISN
ncbi:MAG TPA: hypothetical protein VGQ04_00275 [Chitinophagaceae bacterium]|nr:hypothetical protein [Chitinophagaceae bacterium]